MSRGHGAPGLLSGLRPASDIFDDGNAKRVPFLDVGLGKFVSPTSWTLVTGSIWSATVNYVYDGMLRDVISVATSYGTLTRVETQAAMTAGTYYCPISSVGDATGVPHWDTGSDKDLSLAWDDGTHVWDGTGGAADLLLYVWLPSGQDPRAAAVLAHLGFFFSTVGSKHPWLGPNKLPTSADLVAGWTAITSGAGTNTVRDDYDIFKYGTSSIRLESGGVFAGTCGVQQTLSQVVAGEMYRVSGAYRTSEGFSSNLSGRLLIGKAATEWLFEDGQRYGGGGFAAVTPTEGEWRRFIFDIVVPAGYTTLYCEFSLNIASAAAGFLHFDDLAVQRIYRFNNYEPRLGPDSLPDLEVSSQTIFFGGKTMGLGTLKLNNADGKLTSVVADLLCEDKPAGCYVGGFFADGLEVFRDDWQLVWPAYLRHVQYEDGSITFDADDARNKMLDVSLPLNAIGLDEFPNANLNDVGYAKPYRFVAYYLGTGATVVPRRVDKDASTGYGTYLLNDPAPRVADFNWTNFTAFTYSAAAFPNRSSQPLPVLGLPAVAAGSRSFDAAAGTLKILANIIDLGPSDPAQAGTLAAFDFNIGAGALAALAFTPVGSSNTWFSASFAATLQAAMRAVSGAADINVTYSETTHLFTVSKGAGTLQLLIKTGANAAGKWWSRLGLTNNAASGVDYTGALSYTSDVADFTDVDRQHAVLVRAAGYVDDASGTITGTPNDYIHTRASIAHFILRQVFGFNSMQIDTASFYAGHQAELAAEIRTGTISLVCNLHLEERIRVADLVSNLERTAFADLFVDLSSGGDWRWKWRMYSPNATPVADFFDRDFVDFKMWQDPGNNVFASVELTFGQNPPLKTWDKVRSVADGAVALKYGRTAVLQIQDYTHAERVANARLIADRFARLAAANPRMVSFTARRKALTLAVGDIVTITRARGLDVSGALAAVRFRVIGTRRNAVSGEVAVRAVEDVPFWS